MHKNVVDPNLGGGGHLLPLPSSRSTTDFNPPFSDQSSTTNNDSIIMLSSTWINTVHIKRYPQLAVDFAQYLGLEEKRTHNELDLSHDF